MIRLMSEFKSPWPVRREGGTVFLSVGRTTSGMAPVEARALALELIQESLPEDDAERRCLLEQWIRLYLWPMMMFAPSEKQP